MVMTRPPALHVCKFLMKNMIPTNSGLIDYKGAIVAMPNKSSHTVSSQRIS